LCYITGYEKIIPGPDPTNGKIILAKFIILAKTSVSDPYSFDTDPDPAL
jgi:hypothetical protein